MQAKQTSSGTMKNYCTITGSVSPFLLTYSKQKRTQCITENMYFAHQNLVLLLKKVWRVSISFAIFILQTLRMTDCR